jgi:Flp pilus assembly protein TadG
MRRGQPRRRGERGQSLVEFTMILPVLMLILMSALEFGSAIDHRTAMAYAVREGARVGASLGAGGTTPNSVDPAIIAAVQRGLTDPILMENITSIEIYKASSTGQPIGTFINKYDRDGVLIGTAGWPASTRVTGTSADSIGVRVKYAFRPQTPLAPLMALFMGGTVPYTTIPMTDTSVMRLEPPKT